MKKFSLKNVNYRNLAMDALVVLGSAAVGKVVGKMAGKPLHLAAGAGGAVVMAGYGYEQAGLGFLAGAALSGPDVKSFGGAEGLDGFDGFSNVLKRGKTATGEVLDSLLLGSAADKLGLRGLSYVPYDQDYSQVAGYYGNTSDTSYAAREVVGFNSVSGLLAGYDSRELTGFGVA